MNGRIYDPLLGRFLSADLVIQFPGSLQSYNRYSYVMNNPLTLTDPSGFSAVSEFVAGVVVGWAEGVDPTMGTISNAVEQHVQSSGVPGAPASLSTAETAGRVAGNLAAMVQGFGEIVQGSGLMAGGAAATGLGTAGGVATSPTGGGAVIGGGVAVAGAVVGTVGTVEAAHGILSVAQGGAKAVKNLQNLTKSDVKPTGTQGQIDPAKKDGKYSHLKEPRTVGEGRPTTRAQRARIFEENKKNNGGVIKSDKSGVELGDPKKLNKGDKRPPNEAQVDHIEERSTGGSNSNSNQQVLSFEENLEKELQRRKDAAK